MSKEKKDNYRFGLVVNPYLLTPHNSDFNNRFRNENISMEIYNIIDFSNVQGLTLGELREYKGLLNSKGSMFFIMYDSLKYYDRMGNDEHSWVRYDLEIDSKNNNDKLVEDVIRDAIKVEYQEQKYGDDFTRRANSFLKKYTKELKEKKIKSGKNYLYGIIFQPCIEHQESFDGGFKPFPLNTKIGDGIVPYKRIKGLTIEELSKYSSIRKDEYMYFVMYDNVVSDMIVQYYYEINIQKEKDKFIDDVIATALEMNIDLGGSFSNRSKKFIKKYGKKD